MTVEQYRQIKRGTIIKDEFTGAIYEALFKVNHGRCWELHTTRIARYGWAIISENTCETYKIECQ